MESAPNQVGWVPVIGELYYVFNPIFLDDSRPRKILSRQDSFRTLQSLKSKFCPKGAE